MARYWKIALALGGLAALWLLSRDDEAREPSSGRGSGGGARRDPAPRPAGAAAGGPAPGASSPQKAASPEADGGVVRDGRMRGGTWNFAPSDAPADAAGFLVLRDVPKSTISVDGRSVELRGGFRGFRDVPSGGHKLELEGYGGAKVTCEIEMPPGGCIVLIYEDTGGPPRLEPDRDWGPQYIGLAMGGAMGQALWPWPEEK